MAQTEGVGGGGEGGGGGGAAAGGGGAGTIGERRVFSHVAVQQNHSGLASLLMTWSLLIMRRCTFKIPAAFRATAPPVCQSAPQLKVEFVQI